jgi:trimethylamine:corrinoid methyltransferase-like protein
LLDDALIQRIVGEARDILCSLGVVIHNKPVLELLAGHGAEVTLSAWHARLTPDIIDRALGTVAHSFRLYDVVGNQTHDFAGANVYFTRDGAINILDQDGIGSRSRRPDTVSALVVSGLAHIASQSTALIPGDVHERLRTVTASISADLRGEAGVTGASPSRRSRS